MIGLQFTPRQLEAARASGLWLDKTLLDFLDEVTPGRLDKVALTDSNSGPGPVAKLTYGQLLNLPRRIGVGLPALFAERYRLLRPGRRLVMIDGCPLRRCLRVTAASVALGYGRLPCACAAKTGMRKLFAPIRRV